MAAVNIVWSSYGSLRVNNIVPPIPSAQDFVSEDLDATGGAVSTYFSVSDSSLQRQVAIIKAIDGPVRLPSPVLAE